MQILSKNRKHGFMLVNTPNVKQDLCVLKVLVETYTNVSIYVAYISSNKSFINIIDSILLM